MRERVLAAPRQDLIAGRLGPGDRLVEREPAEAAPATEAGEAEAITDVNTRFHDRILAMAGNALLISVMEPVDGRLRWLTRRNAEWPQPLTEHYVRANYRSTVRHLFGEESGEAE
ncbi:FCD domain-containing protein [Streptomyces sp. NRRL F-2799]|uniref:FCD domain-containing protein n=1 Tax=Streptomyces sp. NRRL F-2799 TaxID=1463844 RepID=UPI000AA55A49|nr:FCD domain-containing protein [Streptomyces sp. NRRL F-2799]